MSEETGQATRSSNSSEARDLGELLRTATVSGLVGPVKRNLFKALGQLCSAMLEIPIAHFEGLAEERRAATAARVSIIGEVSSRIRQGLDVNSHDIESATEAALGRINRAQENLNRISRMALADVIARALPAPQVSSEPHEKELEQDWLNSFEVEAGQKSSEEMRLLFARVLAEEIVRPESFSVRTVKLLGQLDSRVAKVFQILCSISVVEEIGGKVEDVRALSLGKNAGENALGEWGLNFYALNQLEEYGLIIPIYHSWKKYLGIIAKDGQVKNTIRYCGREWGFVPEGPEHYAEGLKEFGIMLTQCGRELYQIVDRTEVESYTARMKDYFAEKHLKMVPVRRNA